MSPERFVKGESERTSWFYWLSTPESNLKFLDFGRSWTDKAAAARRLARMRVGINKAPD